MEVFTIAPANIRILWLVGLIPFVVMAVVSVVLWVSFNGARGARFEVSPEGLRLRGDWYGRLIPADHVQAGMARQVDLTRAVELLPARKTMGTSFSGYQSGWFRLRNGERALLYLTDRQKAVYIPTTDGYSVLVSPADPDRFLAALQTVAQR